MLTRTADFNESFAHKPGIVSIRQSANLPKFCPNAKAPCKNKHHTNAQPGGL
jgi:hypothetical protein